MLELRGSVDIITGESRLLETGWHWADPNKDGRSERWPSSGEDAAGSCEADNGGCNIGKR